MASYFFLSSCLSSDKSRVNQDSDESVDPHPAEEARELEQLVDMFPQYERADLLRELRDRRPEELAANAIIFSVFRELHDKELLPSALVNYRKLMLMNMIQ
mmetsp:Transcript_5907/g.7257  ORF Transcript_5907/g.7257 Transcript_5907/m.7257 type:complete len:101 (+) Transcript_5907:318-620(+)